MSDCKIRHDIKITRGDSWQLLVGMARGWEDIDLAPHKYEARLALREEQDDDLPDIFEMTSDMLPAEDRRFENLNFIADFKASPAQTQTLPDWDMVCYCELRTKDGAFVRRLFNGRAKVDD